MYTQQLNYLFFANFNKVIYQFLSFFTDYIFLCFKPKVGVLLYFCRQLIF